MNALELDSEAATRHGFRARCGRGRGERRRKCKTSTGRIGGDRAERNRPCATVRGTPHRVAFGYFRVAGNVVHTQWHGSGCCGNGHMPVSYTHLRAHETDSYLVCRLLLEKKKKIN